MTSRHYTRHRPGRIDLLPLQWVLLAAVASWMVLLGGMALLFQLVGGA